LSFSAFSAANLDLMLNSFCPRFFPHHTDTLQRYTQATLTWPRLQSYDPCLARKKIVTQALSEPDNQSLDLIVGSRRADSISCSVLLIPGIGTPAATEWSVVKENQGNRALEYFVYEYHVSLSNNFTWLRFLELGLPLAEQLASLQSHAEVRTY
jgi:hypothetical protein